jgi:AcrR family transcriptional regulator
LNEVKEMPKSLQSRKRQLVRDAIYDAAIGLFAKKGFDETTVEEVAEAAGISRRSFFRYFESKDDLLALNTVNVGEKTREAVGLCPASLGLLAVVRETALAGVRFTEAEPHTRQIIDIAQRSPSARQAHLSRLMEIEDRVASAFSLRMKATRREYMAPRLLAGLSQLIMNTATASWYMGEYKDISTGADKAILFLKDVFCDESAASLAVEAAPASKTATRSAPKKHPKKKK